MDTDYVNYSFVYSSTSLFGGLSKQEFFWIYTRKPLNGRRNLKKLKAIRDKGKQIFEREVHGFDFDAKMRYTLQGQVNSCKYYTNPKAANNQNA